MTAAGDRLSSEAEFEAAQYAAIDAVIEDPRSGRFPQRRDVLAEGLGWLEAGMYCTACLEGRCDEAGPRHAASAVARERRSRWAAVGLLPWARRPSGPGRG
ncbi:hypothetical protein [Amycolatopsis sp. PS_44_ISF1]|uniref:hypothetical protein n=1 Tax=Amycolatopsis sp. PS_44_ISF1 TaxID=2974917 RepID=UPI0028DE3F7D|nr:hypothetical protein [Amycolatopsis sp. PS_44_ISF1]MDT8912097.1 hypothetical protein [Amycolatopsis sp. PS_44_ISF1]